VLRQIYIKRFFLGVVEKYSGIDRGVLDDELGVDQSIIDEYDAYLIRVAIRHLKIDEVPFVQNSTNVSH
jgi:hypothetical protein